MKIGVDAGCLGMKDTTYKVGVYQVVKNSLLELAKIDKKNQYLLYSFEPIEKTLMKQFGKNMKNIVVKPAKGWMKVWLPMRLFFDSIDIFIAANQAIPPRLPRATYKTIGIIYDIAFEKYPELYSYAASVSKHKLYSVETARFSDIILSISQKTKEDLIQIYGIPQSKIVVGYPGIVPLPITKKYKTKTPYFLSVGALKKGKNIPTLLRAFAKFKKISKSNAGLYIVGTNSWMDPEITYVLHKMPKEVMSSIHILGTVTSKKLSALYRGAIAFVSPSLYEGFGLPFVEAMSIGCPIIGSDRGSIPEVVGKAGVLKDAMDIDGIANTMEKVLINKKFRNTLIIEGKKQSKKYSFKNFAKAIYSAIASLA